MYKLARHYAISSFVSVLVAAVLLVAFYRHLEFQETTESARKSNLASADALLDSIRPDLGAYLASVTDLGPREISQAPFPPLLASAVAGSMEKASIDKVTIYNKRGVILFSTDRREVGTIYTDDSGFVSARNGQAASDVRYRGAFSSFGRSADTENLARTIVPVRLSPVQPVLGGLATQADLSPMVAQDEREVLAVTGGIAIILMLLYSVLLFVVMRANKLVEAQHETIRERTATLEALSVQLLASAEAEKLNLAVSLHEGLAPTLTAIKSRIEGSLERSPANGACDRPLTTTVSALQGAIEGVQEMATELRPSSLDRLGLLPTIRWYCREFEYLHPDIQIEQQISLQEPEIPEQLKIVIYRIVEAVFKDIGKNPHKNRIRLSLQPNAKAITLAIDDFPQDTTSVVRAASREAPHSRLRFAAARERATLSGGAFTAGVNREGGITLHASWAT